MEKKRTPVQNNALHLYFKLLAERLNDLGLDMRVVLKPEIEIPWSTQSVKEFLWKPIQRVYLQKQSTTELNKDSDINDMVDVLNRHLSDKFGKVGFEFVQFPSLEQLENELKNNII